MEDDSLFRDLLENFMQGDENERQHLLVEQGKLLLSQRATDVLDEQITELTEILETLKNTRDFLETTRQQRAQLNSNSEEPETEFYPTNAFINRELALPIPQNDLSGLNVNDLLPLLGNIPSPHFSIPTNEELVPIISPWSSEFFLQASEILTDSSPEQLEQYYNMIEQSLHFSEEQKQSFREHGFAQMQWIRTLDKRIVNYFIQEIMQLSQEQREQLGSKQIPAEQLLDLAKMQAFIEEQGIEITSFNESLSAKISDNKQVIPSKEVIFPIIPDEKPATSTIKEQREPASEQFAEKIQDPLLENQEELLRIFKEEFEHLSKDPARYQLSRDPDYFDRIDTTKHPEMQKALDSYRAMYQLQHGEITDITPLMEIVRELMGGNTQPGNPKLQATIKLSEAAQHLIQFEIAGDIQELEEAITKCNDVLAFSSPQSTPLEYGGALLIRSSAYLRRHTGDREKLLEQTLSDCTTALEIFRTNHIESEVARAHMIRGAISSELATEDPQKLDLAIEDFAQALLFFTKEHSPGEWAEIHLNRSTTYLHYETGDIWQYEENALNDSLMALSILSRKKRPQQWAMAHKCCGDVYKSRFTRNSLVFAQHALDHYTAALTVLTPQRYLIQWAETTIARCKIQRSIGEFRLAKGRRENSLGDFFPNNLNQSLKDLQFLIQENKQIIADLTHIITLVSKTRNPFIWADAHFERGYTKSILAEGDRQQYLKEILIDYNQALEVFTHEHYPIQWADTHHAIANTFMRYTAMDNEQDAQRALLHIDATLQFYTPETTPFEYYRALRTRSIMYERLGRWEEARQAVKQMNKIQRTQLLSTIPMQHKLDISAQFTASESYLHLAQIALRLEPPDYTEALLALEEGRSQSIHVVQEEYQNKPIPVSTSPITIEEIATALPDRQTALVYLATGMAIPLGAKADVDEHFRLGTEEGLALILTKDEEGKPHITHRALPHLTQYALGFLMESTQVASEQKKRKQLIPIKLETLQSFAELGLNDVVQALRDLNIHKVTFILYSILSLFPLPAIPVKLANEERHYLGDLFELTFVPSATVALRSQQCIQIYQKLSLEQQRVLVAGNPQPSSMGNLPHAELEAQIIQEIVSTSGYATTYLEPEQITKERLLSELRQQGPQRITSIHLAAHGLYRIDEPLDSQLILAGTIDKAESERTITVKEILEGSLNLEGVRLLVLSACQTSVIDIQQTPNEVIGLASAFLYAGVGGVIASLWQVDDLATMLLMRRFAQIYFGSRGEISPALALRQAQHWLREEATYQVIKDEALQPSLHFQPEMTRGQKQSIETIIEQAEITPEALPYAHPSYWAAFLVSGQ